MISTIAGFFKSITNTTPAQRKEKGNKPLYILSSLILPVSTLRILNILDSHSLIQARYLLPQSFAYAVVVEGAKYCAGYQLGHIGGRCIDKYME
jgi:hypothetical protein